jgi:hypothetical protein
MIRTKLLTAVSLILALIGLAGSARAQFWQRDKSTLSVTNAVRVPGAVLQPGTYAIRVVDSAYDRNIVQITSPDGNQIYATIIGTPDEHTTSRPNTEFVFYQDADGKPIALRSWWAGDERFGQDFLYSSEEAAQISRLARENVPQLTSEMSTALAHKVSGQAANPPANVEPQETTSESKPEATTNGNETPKTLPRTASDTPLLLAIGLLALGAAVTLRLRSSRA